MIYLETYTKCIIVDTIRIKKAYLICNQKKRNLVNNSAMPSAQSCDILKITGYYLFTVEPQEGN